MEIKFISDMVFEKEKEDLDRIIKLIRKKPPHYSKEADFLRKFTLALHKKYRPESKKQKMNLHIPTPIQPGSFMPQAPTPIYPTVKVPEPIQLLNPPSPI